MDSQAFLKAASKPLSDHSHTCLVLAMALPKPTISGSLLEGCSG